MAEYLDGVRTGWCALVAVCMDIPMAMGAVARKRRMLQGKAVVAASTMTRR